MKNLGKRERGRIQELTNFLSTPYYFSYELQILSTPIIPGTRKVSNFKFGMKSLAEKERGRIQGVPIF